MKYKETCLDESCYCYISDSNSDNRDNLHLKHLNNIQSQY